MPFSFLLGNPSSSPSRLWRTVLSLLLLIFWVCAMLCLYSVWRYVLRCPLDHFFMVFHRGCARVFRLNCTIEGEVVTHKPALYLSNHVSYLDIFVLGAYLPGYFIAKYEVASWPVLGPLSKLQNTLFFERKSRRVRDQLPLMANHYRQGGSLILFPEGTSTDGDAVKPFKSSLLQSIELSDRQVFIQPVSITYVSYAGSMMSRFIRDHYAWYGDMPFVRHFLLALGMGQARVEVKFHMPVLVSDFEGRKECAHYCWQQVSQGVKTSLSQNAHCLSNAHD